jgi:DsbC/DsbD-like thiol-disulfide interchange protein
MCIPGKAELSLTLPIKSQPPAPDAQTIDLFTATRKSLPRPVPGNWRFSVADAHDSFVLTANLGHQITQAIFFPLAESQIDPVRLLLGRGGQTLSGLQKEIHVRLVDQAGTGIHEAGDGRITVLCPVSV